MRMHHSNQLPYLKSMMSCLGRIVNNGYKDNFKVVENGLVSRQNDRLYSPAEVKVISSFRFEGFSDPTENAIVYIIETSDGTKGTLVDAYGIHADPIVSKFMGEASKARSAWKHA